MQARSDAQIWPEELDALIAAPKHHVLLFENEAVRVLDTRVGPGETVPLHTHRWPSALYIMSWSDFVRRDAEGKVVADSRPAEKSLREARFGQGQWRHIRWRMWVHRSCERSALR